MNTVIYLHIPKTAGTSLRKIVERFYKEKDIYRIYTREHGFNDMNDFLALPDDEKRKIKVIYGHLSFGIHQYLPQSSSYVTLLRNPVDRIISLFHHVSNDSNHPYYARIKNEGLSIGQFVRMGVATAFEADNHQTRILSGEFPEHGKCTSKMLDRAKDNIIDRFAIVGLTEYFMETVLLMKNIFGWETTLYHNISNLFYRGKRNQFNIKTNVSVDRIKKEDLHEDDANTILEFNALDMELYRFAESLFHEQVNKQGARFKKELEEVSLS